MKQIPLNDRHEAVLPSPGKNGMPGFPFRSVFSLRPLIDFWRQTETITPEVKRLVLHQLEPALQRHPELALPIEDLSILDRHQELLQLLMSAVFAPGLHELSYAAAIVPFRFQFVYTTERFKELGDIFEGASQFSTMVSQEDLLLGKTIFACTAILKKFYGIDMQFEYPVVAKIPDPRTGLERYFKFNLHPTFVEITCDGEPPPISADDLSRLQDNLIDLNVWLELLPPAKFRFEGFAILQAIDVTVQEILSTLKNDLIEKDTLGSLTRFLRLQEKLRALLRCPDVLLGMVAVPGDRDFVGGHGMPLGNSFILKESCRSQCSNFCGSIYERAIGQRDIVAIEDLSTYQARSIVEDQLLEQGIRNIVVAPLYVGDTLVGVLELGSPNTGDVNDLNALRLKSVLPLFALAAKRSMEELSDRVQSVIKEQCTAIHESVEWRFRDAALNFIEKNKHGKAAELEPIVFDEVYPLYGLSDIRNSSAMRNQAIQSDLIETLHLAKAAVERACQERPLPFLDKLRYRIDQRLNAIKVSLGSGDEVGIIDFLHREVESQFDLLATFGKSVAAAIAHYRTALDPEIGVVYRARKDFEDSVTELNDTISDLLEAEQKKAQAMFPHYFEKYKTDGVDHNIYIGKSLEQQGRFHPLYLKNLRLWQLLTMCEVVRLAEDKKLQLKTPLEMAHLILAHETPLSIRFRLDEKQFDVDGAYNVRYEIMKKRIDKATIAGSGERLTQPGKIAIVYSQPKEAAEYREYCDYLRSRGYLSGEVENLELEELQGISGLRSLRVTVAVKPAQRMKAIAENGEFDREQVAELAVK